MLCESLTIIRVLCKISPEQDGPVVQRAYDGSVVSANLV